MLKKLNLENNSFNRLFLFGFTFIVLVVSMLTPPFQSPDEINHFNRAYGLSHFEIIPNNGIVKIDKNLDEFEKLYSRFPFKYDTKNTAELQYKAKEFYWSVDNIESQIPNTAVYSPFSYIPQTIGIWIGKLLDLSIYNSYTLSKVLSMLTCLLLIYISNRIYTIPSMAYIIILFPMSLFQIGSTSPDGIAFCISILIGSLFAKAFNKEEKYSVNEFVLLNFCVLTLLTTRINMLPVLILPFLVSLVREIKYKYIISIITSLVIFTWIFLSYKNIMGGGEYFHYGMSSSDKIIYYLFNPLELFRMYMNTFTDFKMIKEYIAQTIGVLGWLDTPLSKDSYYLLIFIISIVLLLTYNRTELALVSILLVILTILLTFFILLISWTNISDPVIQGVQGRYFIPLLLIVSFISFSVKSSSTDKAYFFVILMMIASSYITFEALISRYLLS